MKPFQKALYCCAIASVLMHSSCSVLEKASIHGLTSGFYTIDSTKTKSRVYLDVTSEKMDVYKTQGNVPAKEKTFTLSLAEHDSILPVPLVFKKQSLDIDVTTVLFKHRFPLPGMPAQLTTDFNAAVFAGWRFDRFRIYSHPDPIHKHHLSISNVGYDFGFFAGPGTTPVNPFTTLNRQSNEYSGMILQTGIAGFLESNIASFGLAVGYDHLLNPDRSIWIYSNKPWVGFIVGIALN